MKKFVQTIKNIWSIDELRQKIIVTLALLLTYRLGTHIVLPGIDANALEAVRGSNSGLLGLFDQFAGGAFSQASILALGIMPYISASIFMQLMTIMVPQLQKVQKEGESGRKKINQWTRYLTVIVTVFQAVAYISYLQSPGYKEALIPAYSAFFIPSTVILLTSGTLFVMWLGEKITDKGLGNGTSLLIMVGILARFPQSIVQEFTARNAKGGGGVLLFIIEIAVFIGIVLGLILLVQGVRKITVNYAKQIVGNRQFGGARQFLPIKVNSAGVMPIIFAQAIIFIPTIFARFDTSGTGFMRILNDQSNGWYMLIYAILVIAFTYLYTAIIFNPKQIAEDLKRNNGFIPGVKPGQPTADYIGNVMDKVTLPGSILLAFVGILPGLVNMPVGNGRLLVETLNFSTFFGGTSLLIMVGVILDTLQQIETQLLMRQYDGLMNSGRIQGRAAVSSSPI